MPHCFTLPPHSRHLNYTNYLQTPNQNITQSYQYNSHNTHILTVQHIK
ncbi:hypothetical protein [Staphylococcus aureus]